MSRLANPVDPHAMQAGLLVGHQRDDGIDDDGHAGQEHPRELVYQRLPAARWQQDDGRLAVEETPD